MNDGQHNMVVEGLRTVFTTGTEAETLQYIQNHFMELPEDIQQKILVAMASDAMQKEIEELEGAADFKSKVAEILKEVSVDGLETN